MYHNNGEKPVEILRQTTERKLLREVLFDSTYKDAEYIVHNVGPHWLCDFKLWRKIHMHKAKWHKYEFSFHLLYSDYAISYRAWL